MFVPATSPFFSLFADEQIGGLRYFVRGTVCCTRSKSVLPPPTV